MSNSGDARQEHSEVIARWHTTTYNNDMDDENDKLAHTDRLYNGTV